MSFSAMPSIAAASVAINSINSRGGASSTSTDDAEYLFIAFMFSPLIAIGMMVGIIWFDRATTRHDIYDVPTKVVSWNVVNYRVSKHQVAPRIFYNLQAPNGVVSRHNSGYRPEQCPIVDQNTPVTLRVDRRIGMITGDQLGWFSQPLATPCRSK